MNQDKKDEIKKKLISRREFLVAGGAVIIATALSACTPKTTALTSESITTATKTSTLTPTSETMSTIMTSPTPKYGGVLRMNFLSPESSIGWMPDVMPGSGTEIAVQPCLEPLLREDNKGNITPWLAESYEVADDLKSITFTLRKGVKFHDGSDFNAEIAKWNLDNMINAKVVPSWGSVDTIDDYTIRVNFTHWDNTVLDSFADTYKTWMVSKAAFDKNGIDWMRQNSVGTGPFKFVSFQKDVSLKFVRNSGYWGKDDQGNQLPYLDGVDWTFVVDPVTKKMMMQAGELDVLDLALAKDAADMKALGLKVIVAPETIYALTPDTANADSPWADQKVREALEYSIDREAIAKAFGYGYLEAPYQIPPSGNVAYDPNFTLGRKYDTDKAKQLLAEAGHPEGFNTTIIASPFGLDKNPVVAVQGYLSKVGIQAEVEYPEAGAWMKYQFGTWHNAVLWTGSPVFPNFNMSLSFIFLPSDVAFQSWLRTPEFTKALNTSLASLTPDVKLIRSVTDMMTRDASYIPISSGIVGKALQPNVMDLGVHERSITNFSNYEQAWLNK